MTDNDIILYFSKYKKVTNKAILRAPYEIINYLTNRYNDSLSLKESYIRIVKHIDIHPLCPNCGKLCEFVGTHGHSEIFNKYCSKECYNIHKGKILKEGYYKKYNTTQNPFQLDFVKEKIKNTKIEKYGNPYFFNTEKMMNTKIQRYGDAHYNNFKKHKQTCLIKYGVETYSKTDECKEKVKQTCLNKYGVSCPFQLQSVQEKSHSLESQIKIFKTKLRNNSFTKSKEEDKIYELLIKKFNNVKRQYIDKEKYPYHCDFYIVDIDTYIEFNGYWTHGKHIFDQNNTNDIDELKNLEQKIGPQYKTKIYVWTILDPKKRQCAKDHNLNYLEFFTIKELEDWLKTFINFELT